MQPRAYANPAFMLTGWPNDDGTFIVAASDSLSLAEFTMRTTPFRIGDPRAVLEPAGIDLRVGMEKIHFAIGASYNEAMSNLFQHWSPDRSPFAIGDDQPALTAPRKELTS